MATSAQTLITSAVSLGYDALSDRDLKECLLVAAQSGGGGGGGGGLSGNGSPQGSIIATAGTTYVDLLTDNFWVSVSNLGTWVELIGN